MNLRIANHSSLLSLASLDRCHTNATETEQKRVDVYTRESRSAAPLFRTPDARASSGEVSPGWWPAPSLRDVADGKALLALGHEGESVEVLQARLMQLGHLPKGTPDGQYGTDTYKAVAAFQKSKGLADDGIVGHDTVVALGLAKPKSNEPAKGRDAQAAVREIDDILEAPVKPYRASSGMLVVRDAAYVNDANDSNVGKARTDAARVELAKNTALEKAALAKLSPQDATRYRSVAARVEQAGDQVARLALQKLLLAGDLPGAKDLQRGHTTLSAFENLLTASFGAHATGGLPTETYRNRLLCDSIQEIAQPASMAQRDRGTCAATVVEMKLAQEQPAEFLRLVTGLAGPNKGVTLANGETLDYVPRGGTESRSAVQQLMAPALMGHTATGWTTYKDGQNDHFSWLGFDVGSGLTAPEVDKLLEATFGKTYQYTSGLESASSLDRSKAALDVVRRTGQGEWVLVGMRYSPAGQEHSAHKLIATGFEVRADEHGVQRSMMGLINPWGRREYIEYSEFVNRLRNTNTQ